MDKAKNVKRKIGERNEQKKKNNSNITCNCNNCTRTYARTYVNKSFRFYLHFRDLSVYCDSTNSWERVRDSNKKIGV